MAIPGIPEAGPVPDVILAAPIERWEAGYTPLPADVAITAVALAAGDVCDHDRDIVTVLIARGLVTVACTADGEIRLQPTIRAVARVADRSLN